MLEDIENDIKTDEEYYRNKRNFYETHTEAIKVVAHELSLPEDTPVHADCDGYSVNIRVAGGPAELKEVFRTFRKLGYEPTQRPGIKPEASFSCRFERETGPSWYFSFSSTKCTRKKIGSKMVEQDIYEVICE